MKPLRETLDAFEGLSFGEYRDLWMEADSLRAKLQAAEAELAEWRETNPTPASLLAERKRADDAEAERTDLSEKLGGLSDKLKDAENDLALVTHDLEMAESKRLQCIERCAELRSRAEAAEAEVARLDPAYVNGLQARFADQSARVAELEAALASAHPGDREPSTATPEQP